MIDVSTNINDYHDARVRLTDAQKALLEERRSANQDRVKRGLEASGAPTPISFVTQGSFAMRTIIKEPGNTFDLDEGIIFPRDALVGSGGADKTALDARKMVRDAVGDSTFGTRPKVKDNCVRIQYSDGIQVDMPVYRCEDDSDQKELQLASVDWKQSHPKGVNKWFYRACETRDRLPLVVRLLKKLCKNRPSYSLPSGFVLTVLTLECYRGDSKRLDENMRRTIEAIHDRLTSNLTVAHPVVVGEWLVQDVEDPRMTQLRELLTTAVEDLKALDRPIRWRSRALKTWKKVFHTDYFDPAITDAEAEEKAMTTRAEADLGPKRPKHWSYCDRCCTP